MAEDPIMILYEMSHADEPGEASLIGAVGHFTWIPSHFGHEGAREKITWFCSRKIWSDIEITVAHRRRMIWTRSKLQYMVGLRIFFQYRGRISAPRISVPIRSLLISDQPPIRSSDHSDLCMNALRHLIYSILDISAAFPTPYSSTP